MVCVEHCLGEGYNRLECEVTRISLEGGVVSAQRGVSECHSNTHALMCQLERKSGCSWMMRWSLEGAAIRVDPWR